MAESAFDSKQKLDANSDNAHKRNAMLSDNRAAAQFRVLIDNRTAQLMQKPNNTGLPENLKYGVEQLSGMSMDHVKVHYNSSQPAQLNARAYAQGSNIHVAPGQEKHLPHEAWHLVQQAQGRVRPTMQMRGGVPVNDNNVRECEVNLMGGKAARVVQGKSTESAPIDSAPVQFALKDIWGGMKQGAAAGARMLSFPGRALMGASEIGHGDGLVNGSLKPLGKAGGALLAGVGGLAGGLVGGLAGGVAGGFSGYGRQPLLAGYGHRRVDSGSRHVVAHRTLSEEQALGRLGRAEKRQQERMLRGDAGRRRGQDTAGLDYHGRTKGNGNTRARVVTPFGTAHVGQGPFNNQPLLGFEPTEWTESTIRTNYDVLRREVAQGGQPMLGEMLEHMEGAGPVTPSRLSLDERTKQAGTALTALLTDVESHQTRNPAGGKVERASVRYAMDHGVDKTYNRRGGAYVPAWAKAAGADRGGTGAFRDMRATRRRLPQETLNMLGYMSDSSDDER